MDKKSEDRMEYIACPGEDFRIFIDYVVGTRGIDDGPVPKRINEIISESLANLDCFKSTKEELMEKSEEYENDMI
jgi:hypothetical protein